MIKLIQKQAIILPNDHVSIVRYSVLGLINKICVNLIYSSVDNFHSHPWDYISIILWGGYRETRWKAGKTRTRIYYPGSILIRKHTDFHRIEPLGKRAITLFWRGAEKQKSNYWVKDNIIYSEARYWLIQGYTKSKMKKLFNYMKDYNG